jgi:hypothetical protein
MYALDAVFGSTILLASVISIIGFERDYNVQIGFEKKSAKEIIGTIKKTICI